MTKEQTIVVKHVLRDGRIVDSIAGHRVVLSASTETAYQIIIGILQKQDAEGRPA